MEHIKLLIHAIDPIANKIIFSQYYIEISEQGKIKKKKSYSYALTHTNSFTCD